MELLVLVGVIFGGFFLFGFVQASKWNKAYRLAIGKYFGMKGDEASKLDSFDGDCDFNDPPIVTSIRFTKGENAYVAFQNVSLMEYKRDGRVGGYGVTLRKKVAPGTFLRAGLGKIGMAKSWQPVSNGTLYATNKGVFFDGDMKNVKLAWDKILKDSISNNEITLEKANGNPLVFSGSIDPEEAAKFTIVGQLYEKL